MHFAVMGAGGLGSYYGGMLARAGERVHFIARRDHLKAMQSTGLRIESPHTGDFQLESVEATDDPTAIGTVDCILMGVKAYDLESASEAIRPLLGADTFVVPLLNGVDMAERIGSVIGMERVLGGTTFASSNVIAPGHARHVLDAPFTFGELGGGRSPRGDALEQALQQAGVTAEQSGNIREALWRKFTMVSALAGTCAAIREPTRRMAADPDTRALFEAALKEALAMAKASGVELPAELFDKHMAFIDEASPQHTVSLLLDLRAGRRLELDVFQGTLVRLGEELGVPTPVNRLLHAALVLHENGASA